MKARGNYKYLDYDSRYAYIRLLDIPQFANEYPEEVPAEEKRHHIQFAQLLIDPDFQARLLHLNKKLVHEVGKPDDNGWHIPLISEIPEEEIIKVIDETTVAVSKDYARKIISTLPVGKF